VSRRGTSLVSRLCTNSRGDPSSTRVNVGENACQWLGLSYPISRTLRLDCSGHRTSTHRPSSGRIIVADQRPDCRNDEWTHLSAKLGVQRTIPLSFRCCVTRFAKTSSFRQGWLVDDRVLAAADNNARWCDLICRLHGIPTATEPGYWVARRRSPDLYPDAVTLLPHAAAEDVLRLADDGPGCSVKDSFGTLDLAEWGFDEPFQAQWILREPLTSSAKFPSTWSVVETEEDLAAWAAAHGTRDTFRRELVRDPSVRVLAAHGPHGLSAGAIAHRTPSCLGVTNVFTTSMAVDEA